MMAKTADGDWRLGQVIARLLDCWGASYLGKTKLAADERR
jgi:hypothetical protein